MTFKQEFSRNSGRFMPCSYKLSFVGTKPSVFRRGENARCGGGANIPCLYNEYKQLSILIFYKGHQKHKQ